jgi:hypothetical protein
VSSHEYYPGFNYDPNAPKGSFKNPICIRNGEDKETESGKYYAVLDGGFAEVYDGGRASICDGGWARVFGGGRAYVYEGGKAHVCEDGKAHAYEGGDAMVLDGGWAQICEGGDARVLKGGDAIVLDGGRASICDGGRAYVRGGGRAYVYEGGKAEVRGGGCKAKVFDGGKATVYEGAVAYFTSGAIVNRQGGRVEKWDGFSPVPTGPVDNANQTPDTAPVSDADAPATEDHQTGQNEPVSESNAILSKLAREQETEVKDGTTEGEKQKQANKAIVDLVKEITATAKGLTKEQIAEMAIEAMRPEHKNNQDNEGPDIGNRDYFWWMLRQKDCKQTPTQTVWNGLHVTLRERLGDSKEVANVENNLIDKRVKAHERKLQKSSGV